MSDRFFDSNNYWETRYKNNGTSGDGSYGVLAIFKGEIINNIIKNYNIKSIIDLGCGDGNQLTFLDIDNVDYIGIDPSKTVIHKLKKKYIKSINKKFILMTDIITEKAELSISCDVLYHLINRDIWEKHIDNLFTTGLKYVIIYAYDCDKDWGNHCKSRKFTDFIEKNYSNWELIKVVKNKYPISENSNDTNSSMSDFYIYKKKISQK